MPQYINKSALVAELERIYDECLKRSKIINDEYWSGQADACRTVLDIIDTIEVKEIKLEKKSAVC